MPRSDHFVCEHLENVSRTALENYQEIVCDYVRRRQGVYELYKGVKLYYVGLASNLRSRLTTHLKDRHGESWDRFSVYLTKSDTHLRELESLVLRIVKPKGNKQIGRFSRSTDIRRRFKSAIRLAQKAELDGLIGKAKTPRVKTELVRRGTKGLMPPLALLEKRPTALRARHKGKYLRARVRHDGRITYNGNVYNSPSRAAVAACGRRTCNGWTFWKYERAPGDWVDLDELRH